MQEIELLKKKIEREILARKEVESLLEKKSSELYQINSNLEQVVKDRTNKIVRLNKNLKLKNIKLKNTADLAKTSSEAKSFFLANMSHELRTPLNAIIGLSELLMEEIEEDEANKTYLESITRIYGAGKHLLALINDILDISKIEAGKMLLFIEEFKLKEVLDEILVISEPLAAKNNNKLKFIYADDSGIIKNDTTKLKQILINLISNACKFTKNGKITLKITEKISEKDKAVLKFIVSDTGIGITKEQKDKLFNNFVQVDSSTTKNFGGTGLGLSISKKMSELMGGNISITSKLGKGTTVTLSLPRIVGNADSTNTKMISSVPEIHAIKSRSNLKILIIEDNEIERQIINKYLNDYENSITFAKSGEDGLEKALSLQPDLIMLDIFLPGLNGWEVLHKLKSNPKTWNINVIIVSMLEEKNKAYTLGATDYLVKPINQKQLLHTLSRYICKDKEAKNFTRVLLVDDDSDSRSICKKVLKNFNVEIDEAINGIEALERISKNKPSIILLDLMMPKMDGFEVIEALKKNPEWQDIIIIVNSAKELTSDEQLKLSRSVIKILHKSQHSAQDMFLEVKLVLGNIENHKNKELKNV